VQSCVHGKEGGLRVGGGGEGPPPLLSDRSWLCQCLSAVSSSPVRATQTSGLSMCTCKEVEWFGVHAQG
jgi:hypothetical protein